MIALALFLATCFLAYSNGANDNFKGVGSLFGIGLATGQSNPQVILNIALSWIITLPCAAVISAGAYALLRHL